MSSLSSTSRTGSGSRSSVPMAARVRWDRVGRVAMLCVLVALVYLYASAGVHMLSTWHQSRRDSAVVTAMEREHRTLVRQRAALTAPGTLETEARQLGMMKTGEQPYVVSGLPNN
jgi:hypothetical protein